MEFQDIKLANGANLLLVPRKDTEAITLLVQVGVGSRNESDEIAGISHFLEHLLFDGTKKRPTAETISRELDSLGAEYNAYPLEDITGYHIKAASEHFEKIADILSDMLINSNFEEKEIEKERRVIIEEIKMREDIPVSHVHNIFAEGIYAGTTLGRRIGGFIKTIESIDKEKLLDYKNKHYLAENFRICVCGNYSVLGENSVIKIIERKFSSLKAKNLPAIPNLVGLEPKKINFLEKKSNQANLIVGFPGPKYNSEDRLAVALLSIILGGNMSSRMFQEIREKQGLAYDVRSYFENFADIGAIYTQAGVAIGKTAKALKSITRQYEKVKIDLSEEELQRAKSYLVGQAKIGLEDSYELAEFFIKQRRYIEKVLTPAELFAKISKVTRPEIIATANKYLDFGKMSIAAIGPESVREDIEKNYQI